MSYKDFPPVVAGAVVFSGIVLKQPHGILASIRGKQRRFMELAISHDFNLTPVLAYYEHPKSSDAVPKGVMYLDGGKLKVFEDRNELSICGEPSDAHDDAQSFIPALPPDVHVVTDLLLGFESSGDADKWFAAIRLSCIND